MHNLLYILGFLCLVLTPILLIILIIKKIRKKSVKKTAIAMGVSFILGIVLFVIGVKIDPQENCEHEFEVTEDSEPTCTTDGKLVKKCTKCGRIQTSVKAASGHQMKEVSRTEPTDDKDGAVISECSVCGYKETVTIPHPEQTTVQETTVEPTTTVVQTTVVQSSSTENASVSDNSMETGSLLMASGDEVKAFIDDNKMKFQCNTEIGQVYVNDAEDLFLGINSDNALMTVGIYGGNASLFGIKVGDTWNEKSMTAVRSEGFNIGDYSGEYCECKDPNGKVVVLRLENNGSEKTISEISYAAFSETEEYEETVPATEQVIETTSDSDPYGEYRDENGNIDREALEKAMKEVISGNTTNSTKGFPEKFASQREKVLSILNAYDEGTIEKHAVEVEKGKLKETLNNPKAVYYGEMKDNYANGYGLVFDDGQMVFCGEFKKGKPSGYGIVFETNENSQPYVYEADDCDLDMMLGVLIRFKASGNGFIYRDHGDYVFEGPHLIYEGKLEDNKRDGKGKEYQYIYELKEGHGPLVYEGEFKNDLYSGKGVLYFENGNIKYDGEFSKGLYDGKGTLYNEDGSVRYKGKFKKGDIK